jgi:hypothetical protein
VHSGRLPPLVVPRHRFDFFLIKKNYIFLHFCVGAFRQATSARRSEALLIGEPEMGGGGARGGRGGGGKESGGLPCPVLWRTGQKSQGFVPPGLV